MDLLFLETNYLFEKQSHKNTHFLLVLNFADLNYCFFVVFSPPIFCAPLHCSWTFLLLEGYILIFAWRCFPHLGLEHIGSSVLVGVKPRLSSYMFYLSNSSLTCECWEQWITSSSFILTDFCPAVLILFLHFDRLLPRCAHFIRSWVIRLCPLFRPETSQIVSAAHVIRLSLLFFLFLFLGIPSTLGM